MVVDSKQISNKSDWEGIIKTINSVNITKSNVELLAGDPITIDIVYKNGETLSLNFLGSTLSYSTDGKTGICDEIDKDILDELRSYYNKN